MNNNYLTNKGDTISKFSLCVLIVFMSALTVTGAYANDIKSDVSIENEEDQTYVITGKVLDEGNQLIIGATIIKKGTTTGAVTDSKGAFSFNAAMGDIFEVSYLGYDVQSFTVDSKTVYIIVLKQNAISTDEVVVVGYGTQKKVNLTGSVEVVTSDDLENRPVTSTSSLLQGQVSGIAFSAPSGGYSPGASQTIQIRGQASYDETTTPLVVIDGVPSDMATFNAMNANDIESVSVLKDAAATAIYGARAPYGVIIINSKMGKRNEKATISYSGNFGISTPVRTPNTVDSYTFALVKNQALTNSGSSTIFTQDQINTIKDNIQNPGKYSDDILNPAVNGVWETQSLYNNDFMDLWFRSSFRHQHDFSIRGGSEKSSYFVSMGYIYQPGTLNFVEEIDNYKRFNFNGGIEADITDWLKISYRSRYSYEKTLEPTTEYNAGRSRLYTYAYGAWPTKPVTNPDGSYTAYSRIDVAVNGGNRTDLKHSLDNILSLDFDFAPGFTAHVDGNWRVKFQDYQQLCVPVYGTYEDGSTYLRDGTYSYLSKSYYLTQYWTTQGYMAYEKQVKDHSFRIQVGAQAEESNYRTMTGTAYDLFDTDLPAITIAQGDRNVSDTIDEWATVGFFGRFNYNYKEKYLFEANGRYDGSGRYSSDQRWGFFPSVSVGWIVSKEDFWGDIDLNDVFDLVKIRASYGTLGNQGSSYGYLHIPTMSISSQTAWIFDNERLAYVNTPGILNDSRTWEKITTTEIGLELSLLDRRLNVEANYYNRLSWDIIGPADPVAAVLGATAAEVNNTEYRTRGFEAQINWRDRITSNWDYSVGFSLADGKSVITKYNSTTKSISGYYEGKEMGELWGYESNGLLTANDFDTDGSLKVSQSNINSKWYVGDVKYEDLNGDGKITSGTSTVGDSGDVEVIGNSTARYRYGINLGTSYVFNRAGSLSLSVFLEGVAKRDLYNSTSYYYFGTPPSSWESSYGRSIYEGEQLDFYRDADSDPELLALLGENTDAFFPRPYDTTEGAKNSKTNTRYLMNAAYMRLKNLNVTYVLPQHILEKIGMASCRVYFSGENLAVLSGMPSYLDPEYTSNGRMYPQQAVYSFGINIGF